MTLSWSVGSRVGVGDVGRCRRRAPARPAAPRRASAGVGRALGRGRRGRRGRLLGLAPACSSASRRCALLCLARGPSPRPPRAPAPPRRGTRRGRAAATSPIALVISAHERIASSLPGITYSIAVGVAVGVDEADDRNAQAPCLAHGDLLGVEVDHEHRVRHALHVLHPAEVGLELGQVGLGGHALARGQQLELPVGLVALEVVQARDALGDRLVVRQQAAQPAMVDVGHRGALGRVLDGVAGLFLRSDEQDRPAPMGDVGGELAAPAPASSAVCSRSMMWIPLALAVDEAAHLGVPAARLVAEVHSGLQQLLDANGSHCPVSLVVWCGTAGPETSRSRRRR